MPDTKPLIDFFKGEDTDVVLKIFNRWKREAQAELEDAELAQAERTTDLGNKSADDLTAELRSTPVGDVAKRQEIKFALKVKQDAAYKASQVTTQPLSEFLEIEVRRGVLVKELESLKGLPSKTTGGRRSAAHLRISEIGKELKAMQAPPDKVIDDRPKTNEKLGFED